MRNVGGRAMLGDPTVIVSNYGAISKSLLGVRLRFSGIKASKNLFIYLILAKLVTKIKATS